MINVYDSKETKFNHNGLCILDSCIKAEVEEEINKLYKLELEYPQDPKGKWKNLIEGNIIRASTPKGAQYFRIYKTTKNISSVSCFALHIFYDLLGNFLEDIRPDNSTGAGAMTIIENNTQYPTKFNFTSDISKTNTAYYVRKNVVEAILGEDENSFINRWGGELNRDNFLVEMKENLGVDRGVQIRYGKNLTGIEIETDTSNVITRVMPTGLDADNNTIILPEKYIDSPLINHYAYPKIQEKHFSDIQVHHIEEGKEVQEGEIEVTLQDVYKKLREKAKELYDIQNIDKPLINYKINFIELSKTEEYKEYALLERIFLGDKVTVIDSNLDINVLAEVIKYKWDCLTDRYIEIELGNKIQDLTYTLNQRRKLIDQAIKESKIESEYMVNMAKIYADGKVTEEEQKRIQAMLKAIANMKTYSDNVAQAKANLAKVEAKAHADNIVTEEEKARIAEAKAKLQEAKAHADAVAKAKAKLAEDTAKSYSDGILTEEEKARIQKDLETLNSAKSHTNNKVSDVLSETQRLIQENKDSFQKAIEQSSNLIKNTLGGYVLKRENELLIMDTQNINTATKIWRWNLHGLGFSNTGYNGTYETAITIDGKINGKFLQGEIIRGITLQGAEIMSVDKPYWNGNQYEFDSKATNICKMTNGGLEFKSRENSALEWSGDIKVEINGTGINSTRCDKGFEILGTEDFGNGSLGIQGTEINATTCYSNKENKLVGGGLVLGGQKGVMLRSNNIYLKNFINLKDDKNNILAKSQGVFSVPGNKPIITMTHSGLEDIPLGYGWHLYNSSIYKGAKFYMDASGVIHLTGAVYGDRNAGKLIGYMGGLGFKHPPQHYSIFPVITGGNRFGRVDISSDGEITFQAGDKGFVMLDGISFLAKGF